MALAEVTGIRAGSAFFVGSGGCRREIGARNRGRIQSTFAGDIVVKASKGVRACVDGDYREEKER